MVNTDRIVPIQKIDLLSMYGTILKLASVSATVLAAADINGDFSVTGTGAAGTFLANQPVKTLDFAAGVTSGTVYFVAGYGFEGITVAGAEATIDDSGLDLDDIKPDAVTLYTATLGSGEVTIAAITPSLA